MRIRLVAEVFVNIPDDAKLPEDGTAAICLADGTVVVPVLALWDAARDVTESTEPGYRKRWGIEMVEYGEDTAEEVRLR